MQASIPTSALVWSEALALGLSAMDDTHREFVELLTELQTCADDHLPQRWQAMIDHTDAHFAREDGWMQATRFAASNCHTVQHQVVLQVLREGAARAAQGDLSMVRQLIGELGAWFPQHAQSMDAALALHLRHVGFDPLTGEVNLPHALPQEEIQGCGGASCSPQATSQT